MSGNKERKKVISEQQKHSANLLLIFISGTFAAAVITGFIFEWILKTLF